MEIAMDTEAVQFDSLNKILRNNEVTDATGFSKAHLYVLMHEGTLTSPVKIGSRCVGWPAAEISAINAGRIAGYSDDELRNLVDRLHAARSSYIKTLNQKLDALVQKAEE